MGAAAMATSESPAVRQCSGSPATDDAGGFAPVSQRIDMRKSVPARGTAGVVRTVAD